ncbi:MAG: sterol desaturase family protein [Pseudomonadota bacterium]
MDLISLAVPFFLIAIVVETLYDKARGSGFVGFNDAIGSLAAGAFNSTTGIFTKVVSIVIYGFVLEHFAVWRMPDSWFAFTPSGILAWLSVLLFWDFMYYWKHRLGHEMSIFWAAHSVHHQSEEYNLTTALRQTSSDFIIGWAVYLPMFFLGVPLHVFATVSAVDLIYQFWVHTRHIDRLGWADYVFVTPSNHRVHHAQNPSYIDKNYGGILIIWDRLFGTFEPESEPVVFGVRKPLHSFNPVNANLHVYRSLIADWQDAKGWRDKLRVWFGRTGWRPQDAEAARPLTLSPLSAFEKYRGRGVGAQSAYTAAQFAMAIGLTLSIGMVATSHGLAIAFVIAIQLWTLLSILGALADGARWAIAAEWSRLALTPIWASIVAVWLGLSWPTVLAYAVAYSGLSAIGFRLSQPVTGVDAEVRSTASRNV